jgi:molecular chaperone DnaK
MARSTIDYGIDLGTTNSAIAVLNGLDIDLLKNTEGGDCTPSAVWIDPSGARRVGREAIERMINDNRNVATEFKLWMGGGTEKLFERSGLRLRPEDLSAEVLKSLRAIAKMRNSEEIEAAVITVPAAFDLPQCDATKRAALAAGLSQCPLLQEPVAAALASGFQSASDKVFWLVYDLGGGTFDAAVIQLRDGVINVVNHEGDKNLGGKDIDWAIVERILVPSILREHRLEDFNRRNSDWASAFAKLKRAAEEAKIRISLADSTRIYIESLSINAPFEVECEIKRAEIESLAEPIIARSLNICKKALQEKRLGSGDIEKIILVGGPTCMPYLRSRLADPERGLGIAMDYRLDPFTVVARGAAIFAGTQRLAASRSPTPRAGRFMVKIDCEPMGPDPEPPVGGEVAAPDGIDLSGYTIELVNAGKKVPWRSGRLPLAPGGKFFSSFQADRGVVNRIQIELCDSAGRRIDTEPDSFSYTVATTISDQPLIHSISVATVDNEPRWFFKKGSPLPSRHRDWFKVAYEVQQGRSGDVIRIPVFEGENKKADRNRRIGTLEVKAHEIRRSVPIDSEIEVSITIDESRSMRVSAYIPILDEEFQASINYSEYGAIDPVIVRGQLEEEKSRLGRLREKAEKTGDEAARRALSMIDEEGMIPEVERSVESAGSGADSAQEAEHRLSDFMTAIDEVESAVEWPALVARAGEILESASDIVGEDGTPDDKRTIELHRSSVSRAMESRDADLLDKAVEELRLFAILILDRKGGWQVKILEDLIASRSQMRDQGTADQLISRGQAAIRNGNVGELRAVNRQLVALLPYEPPTPDIVSTLR